MRRRWWWLLVGSGLLAGGGAMGLLLLLFFVSLTFLAGLSAPQLGARAPAFATRYSRPAEWLPALERLAASAGLPNTLFLAVVEEASDGAAYGDRYYCTNGRTAGEWCGAAYPGAARTLGVGYGLFGINSRSGLIPAGRDPHAVAWNLQTGIQDLAANLRGFWQQGLASFHLLTQAPPGWAVDPAYPDRVRSAITAYSTAPHLGAWALADWSRKQGRFVDPGDRPVWVFAVGVAPSRVPFKAPWKPPTPSYRCQPLPGPHHHPIFHCQPVLVPHWIRGASVALPLGVVGITADGRRLPFRLSTQDPAVPVWPGGTVWGLKVPLAGPHRLTAIVATWPGWTDTIAWPETAVGAVSHFRPIDNQAALAHYWPDILAASCKTGVPAALIAAKMLTESGGNPNAGNPATAYGLMQEFRSSVDTLPGYVPGARHDSALNLLLGAELLREDAATAGFAHSWRLAVAAYFAGPGPDWGDPQDYGVLGYLELAGVPLPTGWTPAVARALAQAHPYPARNNDLSITANVEEVAQEIRTVVDPFIRAHHLSLGCPAS